MEEKFKSKNVKIRLIQFWRPTLVPITFGDEINERILRF